MLSKYALKNEDGERFRKEEDDKFRTSFFRDIDRVLYSMSYLRYADKTQVFSFNENDHITKRMVHVQLVSKIARTIGRNLNLNEDLIEAASLGHDLGHVPFGHVGEAILSKISIENNEGYFNHNIESVRVLMKLENKGLGSNLCWQVLDAIMCHNGELPLDKYYPKSKTKEEFLKELIRRLKENIDVVESSFEISDKPFIKTKLFNIEPYEFHLSILLEDDPYLFMNKIVYSIINKQKVKVSSTNIACDLLLELVNLILDEFRLERIEKIGN